MFVGYATFFPDVSDYDYGNSPRSWAVVPALRHAMTKYPQSTYFFNLSPHALIMNPKISLTSHVMDRKRLESIMLRDKPVVPPDSVIRTFTHLKGDKVDLVLTQDAEGLCQGSFILRRGEWAKFFLDTWFDPLYRSYNFQKAEAHALVGIFHLVSLLADLPTDFIRTGTRGPMAPDYIDKACSRTPEPYKFLRRRHPKPRWQRSHVQRG